MKFFRRTSRFASRLSVAVYALTVVGVPSILHDHGHECCGVHEPSAVGFTSGPVQGGDDPSECSVCHQISAAKTSPGLTPAQTSIEPDDPRRMLGAARSLLSDSPFGLLPPARAPPVATLS